MIAFRASTKNTTSSSPNTVTVPASVQAGDVVIIFTSTFAQNDTITASTSGTTTPVLVEPLKKTGTTGYTTWGLWQFTAAAGDAGATLTFTDTGTSTYMAVSLVAYSGAQALVSGDWNSGFATDVEPWAAPTVTSQAANCWGVYFAICGSDGAIAYTGATQRNQDTTGGMSAYDSNGSVGASGTTVGGANWTSPSASWWSAYTVALRPALPPAVAAGAFLLLITGGL